ncbi:MAG: peptidylprolyl isomerase [Gallionellaceae bacterium]|nr:peptidylprolyl isomerase [Gallionellaceae bacterium]
MLLNKSLWIFLLCLALQANHWAFASQPNADPQKQVLPIDEIVAVVNDDVITRMELSDRLNFVVQQLQKQGTQPPAPELLEKQLLERMIVDLLQTQFAKETGVRVDDTQLDKMLQRIAQENNFSTLADFRARLKQEGVEFSKFREEIRGEIIASRLREREVDSKLVVNESEIDNYLAMQSKLSGKGDEFLLSHILILVPEQAGPDKIQASRQRAEKALAQLQGGSEFAQIAAGTSDAKDALQGGNLGWRSADRISALFLNALQKLHPGEISPILRSPNGFHILKLVDRRSKDAPVVLTQAHVRHILIKTSEIMPESEAKGRLLDIRKSIVEGGGDFAAQAKRYSDDTSAGQGGDLGWISPGDTVPEFENAMNALKIGEVSSAVQTGFGWHLIQVLERRNADVSVEQKRQQARMAIRGFKSEEAYQDWLRQLRDRAYVEYRIKMAGGQQ